MTQKTAAFKSGWDAFIQGVVVGDNPFDEKNDLYWEWMRGWASSATEKIRTPSRMSFKDKYSFWIDRKVDGFVYRFSEFAIKRHAIGAPEHWEKYLEFDNPRETSREWRRICDLEAK